MPRRRSLLESGKIPRRGATSATAHRTCRPRCCRALQRFLSFTRSTGIRASCTRGATGRTNLRRRLWRQVPPAYRAPAAPARALPSAPANTGGRAGLRTEAQRRQMGEPGGACMPRDVRAWTCCQRAPAANQPLCGRVRPRHAL